MTESVNISSVSTIALIQIDHENGTLIVSRVSDDNERIVSALTAKLCTSPSILTKAKGGISIKKIVELLNTIQE